MKKNKMTNKKQSEISGLIKNQDNIIIIKGDSNELRMIIKQDKKLGEALNYLPYGIVNKNVTGIGATTLELKSDRHSIIVVPTKALAYGKYKNDKDKYFYIGSAIDGKIGNVSAADIESYIDRTDIKHKFIVVADSLPRLIEAFKIKQIDAFNKYFLMIDEVDIIQSDSTYRPALENAIDYYLKFKKENRCLVSATLKKFSHPLLQTERMVIIDYPDKIDRKMELICTDNINKAVAEKISALLSQDDEKIIVAYNFITEIHKVIELTKRNNYDIISCGILCSDKSKDSAGQYYTTLNDNDKLENRVTFMTSTYFAGVDINEKCHVISVSTTKVPFTLLSVDKITQIRGRARLGVVSETFIFDVEKNDKVNIGDYHSNLLEDTKNLKEFYNHIDKFRHQSSIGSYSMEIKNAMKGIMTKEVFEGDKIQLTRKDIEGNFTESFFNIDAITELKYLKHNVYTRGERVSAYFKINGIDRSYEYKNYKFSQSQAESAKAVNKMQAEKTEAALKKYRALVDTIGEYNPNDLMDIQNINLQSIYNDNKFGMKQKTRNFHDSVSLLRKYYPIKSLTKIIIQPVAKLNKAGVRNMNRALVFNAMADDFPFRQMILNRFKVGSEYNSDEIKKILTDIYKTCPNIFPILIPKSGMVQHFNCYFETTYTREPSGERKATYKIDGLKNLPSAIHQISLLNKRDGEIIDINKLMAF